MRRRRASISSKSCRPRVTRHASIGSDGENRALAFIRDKGFTLIERNYRAGRAGEIDIIARKDNMVVFFEVKRRRSKSFGGGIYAITEAKKRRIRAVARAFIASRPAYQHKDITFRFDLIVIQGDDIEWVEDMFR